MATSQNGGLVLDYGDSRLVTTVIPGTAAAKFVGGVNGADLNLIFMYIGYRWHTEIEPIVAYGCWGFNVRAIRGQTSGYSNHAAGEAIDINAPQHPLGSQTLTSKQLATLRTISNALGPAIRFGAFYTGRKDEMHAERNGSYAAIAALANRIRNGELPNTPDELLSRKPTTNPTPSKPAPAPAPTQKPTPAPAPAPTTPTTPRDWFDMATKQDLLDVLTSDKFRDFLRAEIRFIVNEDERSEEGSLKGAVLAMANKSADQLSYAYATIAGNTTSPEEFAELVRANAETNRSDGIVGAGDLGRFIDAVVPAVKDAVGKA